MVTVFMGDKYRMNVFCLQASLCESVLKLPDAQSAVNQQPEWCQAARFDDCGVARAATTQAFESQHPFQ